MPVPFPTGSLVRVRNDASAVGTVQDAFWDEQFDEWSVEVRFGNNVRTMSPSQLVAFVPSTNSVWDDVATGSFGSFRSFVTKMTHERLRHPPAAIANALGQARTKFFAYQFKPLLKFLDHPAHRVLVADDVGLGKTIEAGYILREWRARRNPQHLLVVVPARLRTKWRTELNSKFGEQFDLVNTSTFKEHLRKFRDTAQIEPFSWIASYESLRDSEIVALLDSGDFPLDFVIFDEAHRVRNASTQQYRLARALASSAEAMVMLSATPVQTSSTDLYRLLDLLDPGVYGNETTFSAFLEANRPIVTASRDIAQKLPKNAAARLRELANHEPTRTLSQDPNMLSLIQRLEDADPTSREEMVQLQHEVADFSLTGAVISRTRRAEVFANRARRNANHVPITMSAAERQLYEAVEDFVRAIFPLAADWGHQMATLQFYRLAASCMPATARLFGQRLLGSDWKSARRLLGEQVDGDGERNDVGPIDDGAVQRERLSLDDAGERLRAALRPFEDDPQLVRLRDSKYRRVLALLRQTWEADRNEGQPPRKVVIFANFRSTLDYLHEALAADQVRSELIHGGVAIAEREGRISRFLTPDGANILLSSEVGGEGIDLQIANMVVNYDLPWNPMVVEQRIGRIDRIGQRSEEIYIRNPVMEGTVEERIVNRLFQRIQLFQQTIGEMDEIIGDRVEALVRAILTERLTEEEEARRVDAAATAVETELQNFARVRAQADELISADQAVLDEVERLQGRRRIPEPEELQGLLMQYLEQEYAGVRLEGDALRGVGQLSIPQHVHQRYAAWATGDAARWGGRLAAGVLDVTFDAEVALRHPVARVECVLSKHPLIQFVLHEIDNRVANSTNSFAAAVDSPTLPRGTWLVGVWALDAYGQRNERSLSVVAVEVGGHGHLTGDAAEDFVIAVLKDGRELDPRPRLERPTLEDAIGRLKDQSRQTYQQTRIAGRAAHERRAARRRATWENTLRRRVTYQNELVGRLERNGAQDSVLKMHVGKLQKAERELQSKLRELDAGPAYELERKEVGVLLVSNRAGGVR